MRFLTISTEQGDRLAVRDGDSVVDLNQAIPAVPSDLVAALTAGVDLLAAGSDAIASNPARIPYAGLSLAPLVPRPGKIICVGLNYQAHAAEGGRPPPKYPQFFLRSATSLVAANQPGLRPFVSEQFDYEAELAVVIGKKGRHIKAEHALDHVFGYAPFNDMSVRDYQKRTPQWTIGKNFDHTGGFGPELVTADELPPGAKGLRLQAVLNGKVMQDANTDEMIWNVTDLIVLLSECLTLEPGDVIVTGTPSGVGAFREPPVWMKNGDRIEIVIEKVGTLVNEIRDEKEQ